MAKKPKNAPASPNPDSTAKPPAPGPAPSAEELRRLHVETNARDRFQGMAKELDALIKGDLKKTDRLQAIIAVGESVMSVGLHTRGRFRCLAGRGDASLESKAAYIKSCLRKAASVFDTWDTDMSAWSEFVECLKPVVAAAERTVEDLDLPGMKAAIAPSGAALFDDEGQPTETSAAPPAPATQPEPAPAPPAEPEAPVPEARPIQTLGMGPVIDVDVVEPDTVHQKPCDFCGQTGVHDEECALSGVVGGNGEDEPSHPLEGMDETEVEGVIQELMDDFEEAGIENGLKRKDWKAAYEAWLKIWPEDCDLATSKKVWERLMFAKNDRKPISWAVPTDKEFFDFQRKLAIAAGE